MSEIRFAALARRDLEAIDRHYRAVHPPVAETIVARIFAATRLLGDLPKAGPVTARGDRRKWRVADTPYLIFYRIETDHVRILRVIHGARRQARP
ncbi:type II toxin-antitoxin system RelE/ParE family toxin [Sphingomonas cannabina]|uniref:type II toxin-antitoxin system RelE/ParE family toxin n=1 Tax=Sphingomonas cannabina TaxID=2899123 RepID=UPI001F2395D1|nr:type II toxin-antitoxin system RelE/ParE family toxin [Sphingomonas cannabina]UIJ45358.1 type II toxin-antitoxin system RelE/ParE family toxin [Sphingomonas cannabina]